MNSNTQDKKAVNEEAVNEENRDAEEFAHEVSDEPTEQIEETSLQNSGKRKRTDNKYAYAALVAFLLGGVLAVIRSLILFGDYDNKIALYPNGHLKTALIAGVVLFSTALAAVAYFLTKTDRKYRLAYENTGMIFSQSLLAFSFAALAFSIFLASKVAQVSLSTFDSVMICLSLIATVAFVSEAFSKKDTLGTDASVILKLFGPICCLFITFYFYFDKTTPIHNSNKKVATLAFVAALLSLLYGIKSFVGNAKKSVYVGTALLSVCYATAYAIPNLVWYFRVGTPMLLNVFFDVLAFALGAYCAMSLMCFEPIDNDIDANEPIPSDDDSEKNDGNDDGNDQDKDEQTEVCESNEK